VTGKDEKGLIQNKNGSKGKTQELVKKKNPVGARFFATVQTDPGAHLASCEMGTGSLSRG
jgi:hypothetical protein